MLLCQDAESSAKYKSWKYFASHYRSFPTCCLIYFLIWSKTIKNNSGDSRELWFRKVQFWLSSYLFDQAAIFYSMLYLLNASKCVINKLYVEWWCGQCSIGSSRSQPVRSSAWCPTLFGFNLGYSQWLACQILSTRQFLASYQILPGLFSWET